MTIKRLLLLTLLCCLTLCAAGAEEAADITKSCTMTAAGKSKNQIQRMRDRDYDTGMKINGGKELVVESKEPISGVMLKFFLEPVPVTLEAEQDGAWVTVGSMGTHLSDWIAMPEGTTRVRVVNSGETAASIAEIYVYGAGDRPAMAAAWRDAEKADILLLSAHPDDEVLWFGGFLPYYAKERGLTVQVVCASADESHRRLELLDSLWTCGVDVYPYFLNMPDKYRVTLNGIYKAWGKDKYFSALTEAIRRFKPEVMITQDFGGEYGHGAHMAMADGASQCYLFAADAEKYPESAEAWGTWEIKKLYIHLWKENPIFLDWSVTLDSFGGETALSVADRGLHCHQSQGVNSLWTMEKSEKYNNGEFGLYATTVGVDVVGGDVMEHITTETEATEAPSLLEQMLTPVE